MKFEMGYVIIANSNTYHSRTPKVYAIDYTSGGYGYWTDSVSGAKVFKTVEEARKVLLGSDFLQTNESVNGTKFPPRMVHSGADICYDRPEGYVRVCIVPIQFGFAELEQTFEGKIERAQEGVR